MVSLQLILTLLGIDLGFWACRLLLLCVCDWTYGQHGVQAVDKSWSGNSSLSKSNRHTDMPLQRHDFAASRTTRLGNEHSMSSVRSRRTSQAFYFAAVLFDTQARLISQRPVRRPAKSIKDVWFYASMTQTFPPIPPLIITGRSKSPKFCLNFPV